jgi:diguanylate cyclase (GGDEF)-like protein/PAS domain S-box-containing protein
MTSARRAQGFSLRSQLSLASVLLMALVVGATIGLSLWSLHRDVRRGVAELQQTVVDNIARDLDERIELRRNALMQHAMQLGADELPSPQLLTDYVSSHPLLSDLFDALVVIDEQQRIAFDWPPLPGRRGSRGPSPGMAPMALEEPRGAVFGPYAARAMDGSVISFAVPMYSPTQRRIGTLVGVLFLNKDNFLSQLGRMRLGQHGHFVLSTNETSSVIVMHPDARLIRQPLSRAFTGPEADRLVSATPLKSLPWTLSGHFSTDEAYAALRQRERDILLGGCVLMLLGGIAMWGFAGWLLRPLRALREAMQAQTVSPGQPLPALVARSHELTTTVEAFDALMRSRAEAESALRVSEARTRAILTHAPDAFVCIDGQGLIIEWNRQAEALLGWRRDEALQQPLIDLIMPPATRPRMNALLARLVVDGSGGGQDSRCEFEAVGKHGQGVPVELSAAALRTPDGHHALLFLRDISERLRAQAQLAASERDLRTITDGVPAMISYVDADGRYRFANAYHRLAVGVEPATMIGRSVAEAIGQAAHARLSGPIAAALCGEPQSFDIEIQSGDFHVEFTPDVGPDGAVKGFYAMSLDIRARKQAERALADSERRMRTLADNMPALITYIDRDQHYRFCNATFLQWIGLDAADAVGKPMHEVVGHKRYLQRRDYLERALRGERVSFETCSDTQPDERYLNTVYIPHRGADGEVAGVYTMSTDVTTMKQVERQLQTLARFDALTGLPNRRQFEERLPEAMNRCRRSGMPMALMFLDMDRLKMINDTHGHAGGDAVLKELAVRLAASVRATDGLARLAGDEFVVILEGLGNPDEAQYVARKVLNALRHPFLLDGASIVMTASIGVVYHAGDALLTADELVAKADQALYQVKGSGRNAYRLVHC